MMLLWMLSAVLFTLFMAIAAYWAERLLRAAGRPGRGAWLFALAAGTIWPVLVPLMHLVRPPVAPAASSDGATMVLGAIRVLPDRLGAGGSSWIFRGFAADDEPWEIAWAWSRDADGDWIGQTYRLPGGRPIAVGVSGTVEKGQHFLSEGAPLRVNLRSAFCSAASAAEADALSTALMVGASGEGEKFLTKISDGGIHVRGLAYVDLGNHMIYNQTFYTLFLREGRKRDDPVSRT